MSNLTRTNEELKALADSLSISELAALIAHRALSSSKEFFENCYATGEFDPNSDGPLTVDVIASDAGDTVYETMFHYGDLHSEIEKQIEALKDQYAPAK